MHYNGVIFPPLQLGFTTEEENYYIYIYTFIVVEKQYHVEQGLGDLIFRLLSRYYDNF